MMHKVFTDIANTLNHYKAVMQPGDNLLFVFLEFCNSMRENKTKEKIQK